MLLVSASVCLVGLLVRAEWRGRQFAKMTCEQLMAKLHAVGMDNIALVALEYPAICNKTDGLDSWSMIGGWRGLRRMNANTGLLLALAEHSSAWDKHASQIALEAMKQDLLSLRRSAIRSLCHQALARGLNLGTADVHGTARAYHHMAERLLELYCRSPSRLHTHLERAIWAPLLSVGIAA